MQRVSANAIAALKDALTAAFWFKRDLYRYATAAVAGEPLFLSGIDWTGPQYKRDSVDLFVNRLVREQDQHQDVLLNVLVDVAAKDDFPELARLEDADERIAQAREAVARLRSVVAPYEQALMDQQRARERIDIAAEQARLRRATAARLAELKASYFDILQMAPQQKGYALEGLLKALFEVFDLDPRGSFRLSGEQIDGGFSFGSEHFLLEAKWQQAPSPREDLDVFAAKVGRKGENTLGLFVAINGFQPTAVAAHSGQRSALVLMDGTDVYAVLDERIELTDLLQRKRRETAMSGNIYLPVADMLSGR